MARRLRLTHKRPKSQILLTALLLSVSLLLTNIPAAHAASTFTLFGRIISPSGWGATSGTVATPGPTIIVATGSTVTMKLTSADGFVHNWGVDYNGDEICGPPEPCSANFGTTQNSFTFTATTIPGNYTYWCFIHFGPMTGTFVVKAPHDVAVSTTTVVRGFSYTGVTLANPIHVTVTAQNPGNNTETFFVFAKANMTLIGNKTITLAPGGTGTVTFDWTTTQTLARGTYIISSNATKVTGESYFANNQVIGPNFLERIKGDVSGDCKVDIVDLATVGSTFGASSGGTGFNPAADLNNDLTINIVDLVLVAGSFGQIC